MFSFLNSSLDVYCFSKIRTYTKLRRTKAGTKRVATEYRVEGTEGARGPRGPRGRGDRGDRGGEGTEGTEGARGPRGPRGRGDRGDRGGEGTEGTEGARGLRGRGNREVEDTERSREPEKPRTEGAEDRGRAYKLVLHPKISMPPSISG